ncbi:43886_t:CDS:1, partial [Gigaspora margarita]
TDCEHKNRLEQEHYTRHISCNMTSTVELTETFYERKNHLAKEAHAHHIANETVEDAEKH